MLLLEKQDEIHLYSPLIVAVNKGKVAGSQEVVRLFDCNITPRGKVPSSTSSDQEMYAPKPLRITPVGRVSAPKENVKMLSPNFYPVAMPRDIQDVKDAKLKDRKNTKVAQPQSGGSYMDAAWGYLNRVKGSITNNSLVNSLRVWVGGLPRPISKPPVTPPTFFERRSFSAWSLPVLRSAQTEETFSKVSPFPLVSLPDAEAASQRKNQRSPVDVHVAFPINTSNDSHEPYASIDNRTTSFTRDTMLFPPPVLPSPKAEHQAVIPANRFLPEKITTAEKISKSLISEKRHKLEEKKRSFTAAPRTHSEILHPSRLAETVLNLPLNVAGARFHQESCGA